MALVINSPAYLQAVRHDSKEYGIRPGCRVETLKGGIDGDEHGNDRHTPPGSIGWINDVNHVADDDGSVVWDIYFPNGACWNQTTAELIDPTEYRITSPESLMEAALRLHFGYETEELTMYDMTDSAEIVTTRSDEIVKLCKRAASLDEAAAMSWHLFYIEASDYEGVHAFIVSAESDSQAKAEELARAAVLEHDEVGDDTEPGTIDHCESLGKTNRDTMEYIGMLASH